MAILDKVAVGVETELVSQWRERRDLFPQVPARNCFNRHLRNLLSAINGVRQAVLALLDVVKDRHYAIDSVPVPVVQFHRAPSASRDWATHRATLGRVVTKKQTIFGYKLHLLVTRKGVILDFIVAPARAKDLTVGAALLRAHIDIVVRGDNGYSSAPLATARVPHNRLRLLMIPRRNQHHAVPPTVARLLNTERQIIETVHDQLTEQCHVDTNHAHSFWSLCTRLHTKLAAHTLSIYLNRLLGSNVDYLQIKRVAFPN